MINSIKMACLVFFLMFLTSCGFKDIDKRFFVTQMGVDYTGNEEKPYKVILKLSIPKPQIEPGKEQFQIVEEKGANITETIRLLKSVVDKELDFGHAKVIIFGEELARRNIKEPIDWFMRRRDIQKIAYMAIGKPDAESVLRVKPESERLAGNALILSFGKEGTESAYIVTEYLFDFYRRLTTRGLDPFLPVIETLGKNNYDIRRVALFDKTRVKEVLDPDNTRLFNQIAFNNSKFDAVPDIPGQKLAITFEKLNVNHMIAKNTNGKPYIKMKLTGKGTVEESVKKLSGNEWNTYESETGKTFEKRYSALIKKLQKLNLDPIGFGEDYLGTHLQGQKDWETWQELYPTIDCKVDATIKIRSSGNIW